MKSLVIFAHLIFLFSLQMSAQNHSDLYNHVDSLIKDHLKYSFDETTDQMPKYPKRDSSKVMMIGPCVSTMSPNPSPLIILDGKIIKREELDEQRMTKVAEIEVFDSDDATMIAIYGQRGMNGAILIQTKKFKRRARR